MICPHCNKEISDHIWAVHMARNRGDLRTAVHDIRIAKGWAIAAFIIAGLLLFGQLMGPA